MGKMFIRFPSVESRRKKQFGAEEENELSHRPTKSLPYWREARK